MSGNANYHRLNAVLGPKSHSRTTKKVYRQAISDATFLCICGCAEYIMTWTSLSSVPLPVPSSAGICIAGICVISSGIFWVWTFPRFLGFLCQPPLRRYRLPVLSEVRFSEHQFRGSNPFRRVSPRPLGLRFASCICRKDHRVCQFRQMPDHITCVCVSFFYVF